MSLLDNLKGASIKGPDVVINGDKGSLMPTSSSGMRFSSAEINQQPSLLSDLKPYSYGQGSVSDDIAQQVTPHKIQKIVPTITLPSACSATPESVVLSHSVSDGDLAFAIKLESNHGARIKHYNYFSKHNITRAVDMIVNLPTLNFLLRGLQTDMGKNKEQWKNFLAMTGWPEGNTGMGFETFQRGEMQHRNLSMFIQDYVRPLGIVIGSENQGGQHQGDGRSAVDFPVDYVVTILVDGLCDNLLNIWKRADIKAGDDLLLVLAGTQLAKKSEPNSTGTEMLHYDVGPMPNQFHVPGVASSKGGMDVTNFAKPLQNLTYVLNHFPKGRRQERFTAEVDHLYEVVPTTTSEINEGHFLGASHRNRGLWHIARSQVQSRRQPCTDSHNQTFRNDGANLAGGALLQATVAPVWKSSPYSVYSAAHAKGVRNPSAPLAKDGIRPSLDVDSTHHIPHRIVAIPTVAPSGGAGGGGGVAYTGSAVGIAGGMTVGGSVEAGDGADRAVKRRALKPVDMWAPAVSQVVPRSSPAEVAAVGAAGTAADAMQIDATATTAVAATPKVYAQSISMTSGVSEGKSVAVAKVAAKKR